MKLLIHSQTSMVGQVISSHTLQGTWLLIHAVINTSAAYTPVHFLHWPMSLRIFLLVEIWLKICFHFDILLRYQMALNYATCPKMQVLCYVQNFAMITLLWMKQNKQNKISISFVSRRIFTLIHCITCSCVATMDYSIVWINLWKELR